MTTAITIADLKTCRMRTMMRLRGSGYSTYIWQCVEHPRLSKLVTYRKKDRSSVVVWAVDDEKVDDLAAAIRALNATPAEAAP